MTFSLGKNFTMTAKVALDFWHGGSKQFKERLNMSGKNPKAPTAEGGPKQERKLKNVQKCNVKKCKN